MRITGHLRPARLLHRGRVRLGWHTGHVPRDQGAILIDVIVGATIFTGSVVAASVVFSESSQSLSLVRGRQGAALVASNVLAQASAYGCGSETGVDLPAGTTSTGSQPGAPTAASVWQACSYVYSGAAGTPYTGQNLGDPSRWTTSGGLQGSSGGAAIAPTSYTVAYRSEWTPPGPPASGSALAAGAASAYALSSSGTVYAWGDNSDGQLGDGTTTSSATPIEVRGVGGSGVLNGIVALAAGAASAYALSSSGTVYAWGDNSDGQLGDGSQAGAATPVEVQAPGGGGTLTGIVSLAAGGDAVLGLSSSGAVYAWGSDAEGQLGNGTTLSAQTTPVEVAGPGGAGVLSAVASIAEGATSSYAVTTSGTVYAWGDNSDGQLGDGTTTQRVYPVPVTGVGGTGALGGIRHVAAGSGSASAFDTGGTVYAWGANTDGQLGDGTVGGSSTTPAVVAIPAGSGTVDALAAGAAFYLAATTSGTAYAWGDNSDGQLGDGTTITSAAPAAVSGPRGAGTLNGLSALAGGQGSSVVTAASGTVYAWGDNSDGQLGQGGTSGTSIPGTVVGPGGTGMLEVSGMPGGCPTTLQGAGIQPTGQVRTVTVSWNAAGQAHSYSATAFAATPPDATLYHNQSDGGIDVTGLAPGSLATLSVPAGTYDPGATGSTTIARFASAAGCAWFPFLPSSQGAAYTVSYFGDGDPSSPPTATAALSVTSQQITQWAAP